MNDGSYNRKAGMPSDRNDEDEAVERLGDRPDFVDWMNEVEATVETRRSALAPSQPERADDCGRVRRRRIRFLQGLGFLLRRRA